ncbi:hypothetical protein Q9L42_001760 [Methylomarinum sp. Ch1-1]|uniref:Uncharacterized protein n=1 Tax=Methylomarinum roseum TaxID=3067653 RepID=A0AAU7NV77_9GAMM|nr:hypothetical protein [Methylomarinum sp. Ch1-1]MDP4519029.1 hypothetical protein [Methylomarinum sp. Ch1-1]
MPWFRVVRITLLLLIFVGVAFYSKTQRLKSRSWSEPLEAVVYPINGEGSPLIERYIDSLDDEVFAEIDEFFRREGEYYNVSASPPIKISLGPKLNEHPPVSPKPDANILAIAWWGLRFRYWAYRHTPDDESNLRRIRIFTHYHEVQPEKKLQHSLGLDKGLLAIVHAFASERQQAQNNIVIAHELLHTVGATDKYDKNGEPIFPHGYAGPEHQPLYPQSRAEIMAARIPLSNNSSRMADSLKQCIIGEKTAQEINWLKPESAN